MPRRSIISMMLLLSIVVVACGGSAGNTPGNNNAAPGLTPGAPAASTPAIRSAQLSELQNAVQTRGQSDAAWQAAVEGEIIPAGGGAKTSDESRARIDITDGTILRLAANTEFTLNTLSSAPADPVTKLSLAAGKVWTAVTGLDDGSFEIETPAGVATVRGTFMSTVYFTATEHLILTCLEGACRLTGLSGRFTDLGTGQQAEIRGIGNDPSPAQPIDPAEVQEWDTNFPESRPYVLTVTPGPTSTPTQPPSGGGAASGQTACDHPYFPLRNGATWTYSTESGPTTWTVGNVSGDTRSAAAELTFAFGAGQVTWHFQCDASGITSYDFGAISAGQMGQFAVMNVTSQSGVFLPSAELLVPGYSWNNNYNVEIEFDAGGQKMNGTTSRAEQFSVTSANPVTVGGVTFDGLQLAHSGTSSTEFNAPGVSVPPLQFSDSGTIVLARGVGIVQSTSQSQGFSSQSDLLSYSVP